jgi:hypothetical protein
MANTEGRFPARQGRDDYGRLCDVVHQLQGRVRLSAENGQAVAFTVSIPMRGAEADETWAIGFVLGSIDDLDAHAAMALWWLHTLAAPEELMTPPIVKWLNQRGDRNE